MKGLKIKANPIGQTAYVQRFGRENLRVLTLEI
jgi:hypothetical protein